MVEIGTFAMIDWCKPSSRSGCHAAGARWFASLTIGKMAATGIVVSANCRNSETFNLGRPILKINAKIMPK